VRSKKALCLALAFVTVIACVTFSHPGVTASAADNPLVNVILDGNLITTFDVPAQIVNDRTLVPVRGIAEKMDPDAEISWDGTTGMVKVVLPMNNTYAILYVDNPVLTYGTYYVDDTGAKIIETKSTYTMDSPATIINSRTMIPARAVFELALGGTVTWVADTYTVLIASPERTNPPAGATDTPAPTATPSPTPAPSATPGPFDPDGAFREVSAATAQAMYDNNSQFILYYYSSLDPVSIQTIDWVKNSAKVYGLSIYGVDIDSPYFDNSGNKLTFIWRWINSNIPYAPTIFFVNGQNDVIFLTRPGSQSLIDAAMDTYWNKLSTATPSGLDLEAHWKRVTNIQDAIDKYNNGDKFIYVCYNSKDAEASAYTGIIKLAAAQAGVDVYAMDFAGMDKTTVWWGKTALGNQDMKYPTIFFVYSGNGGISDRVTYLVQPGDVGSLTDQFVNFMQ